MISIIYSDEFLDHDTGIYHPEQAARLTAIVEALKQTEWQSKLTWHLPTPIEIRDEVIPLIKQVHNQDYVDRLRRICQQGGGRLDADTPVSARSYDVALLAVSALFNIVSKSKMRRVFGLLQFDVSQRLTCKNRKFHIYNCKALEFNSSSNYREFDPYPMF